MMKRRRAIEISDWERLAAAYARHSDWGRAWPRSVRKPWFRRAVAPVLFAACLAVALVWIVVERGFQPLLLGAWLGAMGAIWFGLAAAEQRAVDPRLRKLSRRRCGERWLARPDAAAKVAARRERWAEELSHFPPAPVHHPMFRRTAAMMFIAMAVIAVVNLLPFMRNATGAAFVLFPPTCVGMLLWQWRGRRRLQRRFKEGACIACGYPFAGLESERATTGEVTVELGPVTCPECGLAWPMVPPEPVG